MGTFPRILHLRTLCMVLLLVFFSIATAFEDFDNWDDPSTVYTYNRFAEIQEKCDPILSSVSELESDDNRGSRIKKELSFINGDWDQEPALAPLMPFNDSEMQRNHTGLGSFLKLVSFWITDVDPVRRVKNMVGVSGIMEIGITKNQPFNYRPGWKPKFRMDPGLSSMTILFEGVYIESKENGGERLICLLGTSMMPAANHFMHPLELVDEYGYKFYNQPPQVQDDQILLILRYSKTFSLTTGNVSGEMKSLHEKTNSKYFDRVHISSHLGRLSKYQFVADELLSKACSPYPCRDSLVDEEVTLFKDDDNFCDTLPRFISNRAFDLLPSWKSDGSNYDASKFGPFVLTRRTTANNGRSNSFMLLVQNLHCDPGVDQKKVKTARVFAVFRVIHSWEDGYTSHGRTGISSMTLSAEGMWRSSEGQLCMIGCLGINGTTSDRCNSRICLYFPLTFSISQRSMVLGTITSMDVKRPYTALWFEKVLLHEVEHQTNTKLKWSYKYSKIRQATAFQMRSKLSVLGISLRKTFLVYPSLNGDDAASLSLLADELSFRVSAVCKAQTERICVKLRILSLGSLVGRYGPRKSESYQEVEQSSDFNVETIETSGQLIVFGEHFNNISLSLEGIYDSTVGKMYLVGCRDVRIIQKDIKEEMNLERGMDCQYEVKVEHPPKNARWVKSPEVRISISSKRSKEDPLYFNPVSLKTDPVTYNEQLQDIIFRRTFEEILRVPMLIIAIVCTRSQLHYFTNLVDPIAYISLLMIYIPATDYVSPLINNGEIFFKWKGSQSHGYPTYEFKAYERFLVLDYLIKVLSLFALLLTLNLGKKVYESRTRQSVHNHKQQSRLPNERKIFLITSAVHIIGFHVRQVIHAMNIIEMVPPPDKYAHRRSLLLQWVTELDGYLSLVKDFFLLPQIVANTICRNRGKPLRKLYYLGLTSLRVLLHVYDYIRDAVPDHRYGDYRYQNMSLESYSKFGNIGVAVIAIVLAVVIYKQQKSSHQELNQKIKAKEQKDVAFKSELHESLLS